MDKETLRFIVTAWLGIVVSTLTIFGLIKLGGYMFDYPPTVTETSTNIEQCWKHGGVPVMDTNGMEDDFKTCKIKGDK